jgi:hypothetical protein
MYFPAEISAIESAWHRAVKISFHLGIGYYSLALCVVLSLDDPTNEFPSVLRGMAQVPEVGALLDQSWNLAFRSLSQTAHGLLIGLGIAGVIALCAGLLMLIFRAPFIRFDVLSGRRTDLREAWRESGGLAFQWFLFSLCAGVAGSALSGFLNLIVNERTLGSMPGAATLISGKDLLCAVVAMYGYWMAEDFLVPVLALQGGEILPAISLAWILLRRDLKGVFRYIAAKTMLVAVSAVALPVAWHLYAHAVMLPLERFLLRLLQTRASLDAVHFAAGTTAALIAIIAAIIVFSVALLAGSGLASAFFGVFALRFYSGRYPALDEVILQQPSLAKT